MEKMNSTIYNNMIKTLTTKFTGHSELKPLISDSIRDLILRIFFVLLFVLNSMGVVTNAINIRVFINQDLCDNSATISLFSLAMADLGSCLVLTPNIACAVLDFLGDKKSLFSCRNITDISFSYPHLLFARLSCWITVYVSIERSLSVLMPLKVKDIFKPRVTTIAIAAISLLVILAHLAYPVATIQWLHSDLFNATVAVSVPSSVYHQSLVVTSILFDVITPTAVALIVAPTFVLMVHTLNKSRRFRKATSSAGKSADVKKRAGVKKSADITRSAEAVKLAEAREGASAKENPEYGEGSSQGPCDETPRQDKKGNSGSQIVKTIAVLWGVFLFCQIMSLVPGIAFSIIPQASMRQLNENVVYVSYVYKYFFDTLNSSTNMFVYVTVSTRYQAAFQRVFRNRSRSHL